MRRIVRVSLISATLLSALDARSATAQHARLSVDPARPSPGDLVRLTLDPGTSSPAGAHVTGTMAGEPLHFRAISGGRFEALGAVPIEAVDSVVATARMDEGSGVVDTARLSISYPHQSAFTPDAQAHGDVEPGDSHLAVDPRFTQPLDAETQARIAREEDLVRETGRRAQSTPQLWSRPFLRPRSTAVTSGFGAARVFNGSMTSNHLGIDYRGAAGEPVAAANRGVVVIVGQHFLGGNVIYIDHGDGLLTGYFHLSKQEVAVGDTVERGQEIGRVGATGRVTGPHLHWAARFGALPINPSGLLTLPAELASGSRSKGGNSPEL